MGANDERIRRERLEATTAERLAEIVAAAERAANQVIDDAEREARRQIEEARARAEGLVAERLSKLTAEVDALVEQANAIRSQSQELLVSLSQLRSQLGGDGIVEVDSVPGPRPEGGTGYGPKVVARGTHLSAVGAESPEPPMPTPLRDSREGPSGARLLATQMAISGCSREEIAERLRNGFEIDDPEAILDAILGPEG
jgi:vacuolar-type H+-ATPase subunit H